MIFLTQVCYIKNFQFQHNAWVRKLFFKSYEIWRIASYKHLVYFWILWLKEKLFLNVWVQSGHNRKLFDKILEV